MSLGELTRRVKEALREADKSGKLFEKTSFFDTDEGGCVISLDKGACRNFNCECVFGVYDIEFLPTMLPCPYEGSTESFQEQIYEELLLENKWLDKLGKSECLLNQWLETLKKQLKKIK